FLLGYALLTGGRPPVMRSAWMVLALCGGMIVQRPVLPANSFALAWLIVAAVNPTDIFTPGWQPFFLAVGGTLWGTAGWTRRDRDPLERMIDETRPFLVRLLRGVAGIVALAYAVNFVVWLAVAPLVAARYHLVSPVALLLGPPLVVLTSIALVAGFLLLLLAPVFWPPGLVAAFFTRWSLWACTALVDVGLELPGAFWYVPDVADWWLWTFYAGLLAALTVPVLRARWRWTVAAGVAWLSLPLIGDLLPRRPGEFRCTFLSVGHGGCTVMETPDGRTLLYDA